MMPRKPIDTAISLLQPSHKLGTVDKFDEKAPLADGFPTKLAVLESKAPAHKLEQPDCPVPIKSKALKLSELLDWPQNDFCDTESSSRKIETQQVELSSPDWPQPVDHSPSPPNQFLLGSAGLVAACTDGDEPKDVSGFVEAQPQPSSLQRKLESIHMLGKNSTEVFQNHTVDPGFRRDDAIVHVGEKSHHLFPSAAPEEPQAASPLPAFSLHSHGERHFVSTSRMPDHPRHGAPLSFTVLAHETHLAPAKSTTVKKADGERSSNASLALKSSAIEDQAKQLIYPACSKPATEMAAVNYEDVVAAVKVPQATRGVISMPTPLANSGLAASTVPQLREAGAPELHRNVPQTERLAPATEPPEQNEPVVRFDNSQLSKATQSSAVETVLNHHAALNVSEYREKPVRELHLNTFQDAIPQPAASITQPFPALNNTSTAASIPIAHPAAISQDPGRGLGAPPIKSLTIELHPAELGTVTVTLRLKQQELELRLETHSEQTLTLLQRDETVLQQVLQAAGFESDAASVQIVLRSAIDSQQLPAPQPVGGSGPAQASFSGSQSGSGQLGGQRGQAHSQQFQSGHRQHDDATFPKDDRPHRGIFV